MAEAIDFRNLDKGDNAVLNLDGAPFIFGQFVTANSSVAAHELGHLLGLRHRHAFGPIGMGILPVLDQFLVPVFTGPSDAFIEPENHVMATGAFGIPFGSIANTGWLSERSSIVLTVAESLETMLEVEDNDSMDTAQELPLQSLLVPNTIEIGQSAGTGDLFASLAVVEGSLDGDLDSGDFYRIEAEAGDILNLAVISSALDRLSAIDSVNPTLSVFDDSGNLVDYYGSPAFNSDEIETTDSVIFDLILEEAGNYFISVGSTFDNTGLYELFVYRFDGNGILGDANMDGVVDLLDVAAFVDLIINGGFSVQADVNQDGAVDLLDVDPFVGLLVGG